MNTQEVIKQNKIINWSWKILLIEGLIIIILGTLESLIGTLSGLYVKYLEVTYAVNWDQFSTSFPNMVQYIEYSRLLSGLTSINFGILVCVISFTEFKNGKKWAWYVMWLFPIYFLFVLILGFVFEGITYIPLTPIILGSPALIALIISYKPFFSKS